MAARLVQDGQVILRTDSANPVLTGGAGNTVDSRWCRSPSRRRPTPRPARRRWPAPGRSWISAASGPPTGVESDVSLTAEGEVQGRGGCNGFRGRYTLDGVTLTLGPIASTRRACPPPQMQQETRFFAALEATRAFRIEDGRLLLLDAAGAPVATLERQE